MISYYMWIAGISGVCRSVSAVQIVVNLLQEMLSPSNHSTSRPYEMLDLQEALNICLQNQKSFNQINGSFVLSEVPTNETKKLKAMKARMQVSQLKDFIAELIEGIRIHNRVIKQTLLSYQSQVVCLKTALSNSLAGPNGANKVNVDKPSQEVQNLRVKIIQQSKELDSLWSKNSALQSKNLRLQQIDSRWVRQVEVLQSQLGKEKEARQIQARSFKKQNHQAYEQNFVLQQKVDSLQVQLEELKSGTGKETEDNQREKRKLMCTISSLQTLIKAKQHSIYCLEETIRNNKVKQIRGCSQNVGPDAQNISGRKSSNQDTSNANIPMYSLVFDNGFSPNQSDNYIKLKSETLPRLQAFQNKPPGSVQRLEVPASRSVNSRYPYTHSSNRQSRYLIKGQQQPIRKSRQSRSREYLSSERPRERVSLSKIGLQLQKLSNQIQSDLIASSRKSR